MPEGDCFAACVASILEVGLGEVPSFNEPIEDLWWQKFQAWLTARGWAAVMYDRPISDLRLCWGIAGGDTSRGIKHAVIFRDGVVEHDPHPSREGLTKFDDYTYLVAIDPARLQNRIDALESIAADLATHLRERAAPEYTDDRGAIAALEEYDTRHDLKIRESRRADPDPVL
jgi:hypothetical protein